MSAAPVASVSNMKSLGQLFAISAGLGIPVGALAYALRNYTSPEPQTPSSTTFADLPLIPSVGGQRKEAGVLSALGDTYKRIAGRFKGLPEAEKGLSLLGGGVLGAGLGYGGLGRVMEGQRMGELDSQLSEREEMFNKLLLQEQMAAAGLKAAEVLDETIETIFEHEFEKQADPLVAGMMAKAAPKAAKDITQSALFPALLAIMGAGYGASQGWGNTVATDRNRAVADALRSSLDERLMGNPEGPRAPMIVKVKTDRIGATPVAGGGKSSGRDVLSRL